MLTLKNILEQLSRTNPFFGKLYALSLLKEHELQILGEHIAKHCTFTDFVDGRLVIVCDDYIWANEIRMLRRKLKRKIHEVCKLDVSEILIKVQQR
ncbi:DUF721 domain-containing protein [Fervidobacterium thailandense]|uniref:DUF721 domain-containing protein n=1 Tax=Fervidobacterium thailandense TaxID=1008305 RepID=A0A1E3G4V6_9BACT|nr:DUF721 domain-containing protein [Fervidobacterium thailandense]ODN31316.1 hypothetical protein A4H02_00670 [Fervidobacterium thailandense]